VRLDWKAIGDYGTVGIEMVLSVMIGFFVGRWLDGKFDTDPYITLVGFAYGIAAAARAVYRAWRKAQRAAETDDWKESETDRPARFALKQRELARKPSARPAKRRESESPPDEHS